MVMSEFNANKLDWLTKKLASEKDKQYIFSWRLQLLLKVSNHEETLNFSCYFYRNSNQN